VTLRLAQFSVALHVSKQQTSVGFMSLGNIYLHEMPLKNRICNIQQLLEGECTDLKPFILTVASNASLVDQHKDNRKQKG
jgi:hypothetical protein